MERRAFAAWYCRNVTLVRRRVVMTLAGSREDDSGSDSDGATADEVGGKKKASLRSLRKLVASQGGENEELQSKLDEALQTIASRSAEVRELQRVAELGSTSSETIDMISEYTEKMA